MCCGSVAKYRPEAALFFRVALAGDALIFNSPHYQHLTLNSAAFDKPAEEPVSPAAL